MNSEGRFTEKGVVSYHQNGRKKIVNNYDLYMNKITNNNSNGQRIPTTPMGHNLITFSGKTNKGALKSSQNNDYQGKQYRNSINESNGTLRQSQISSRGGLPNFVRYGTANSASFKSQKGDTNRKEKDSQLNNNSHANSGYQKSLPALQNTEGIKFNGGKI